MNKIVLGAVFAMLVGGSVGLVMSQSGKASGPRWTTVGNDAQGNTFSIDKGSIVKVGSDRDAWIKSEFARPNPNPVVADSTYATALWSFKCNENTAALKSFVSYGPNGLTGSQTTKDDELNFTPIAPDTIGESEAKMVCG